MTNVLSTNSDLARPDDDTDNEPKFLSENALLLYKIQEEKPPPPKPPPTPHELIADCYITILPVVPDHISDIVLPYVRETGIRDAIGTLAPYFSCSDFENNLPEFWFLDVIVDCIWRAQDEFRFPDRQQKQILEWVLFVFKLLGLRGMTKSLMFQIFDEAMKIAEEYILAGLTGELVPSQLFTLSLNGSDQAIESTTWSSLNSSSVEESEETYNKRPSKQYILIVDSSESHQVYKLQTKQIIEDCLSSSVDSASDQGIQIEEQVQVPSTTTEETESTIEFYKPDLSTPPRFKSLQNITQSISTTDTASEECKNDDMLSQTVVSEWHNIPRRKPPSLCPSKLITENFSLPAIEERFDENNGETKSPLKMQPPDYKESVVIIEEKIPSPEEVFKAFYSYNLWKLKNEYMADSKIGWTSLTDIKNKHKLSTSSKRSYKFEPQRTDIKNDQFINSCMLMAIRQMIFDYFENDFAFELVRISLTSPQFLITQDINFEWNVPKEFKGDFKKPVPKKPKKEKAKKEPKKKSKKDKSSKKSSKKSGKKSDKKKEGKKSKSSKDKKSKKSDKKSKSSKGDKAKKLTKEEKLELEKQKKEQEEVLRQLRIEAENKMFMFPLKDAVDNQFFAKLFPNYKPKKGGPAKAEKSPKSGKSSKSSKSSKSKEKGKKK